MVEFVSDMTAPYKPTDVNSLLRQNNNNNNSNTNSPNNSRKKDKNDDVSINPEKSTISSFSSISSIPPSFDITAYLYLLILVIISILTYPSSWNDEKVSPQHVWYYGWITAISTGLGAVPFFFLYNLDKYWMGVANGIAGGMMIAASYSLVQEGVFIEDLSSSEVSVLVPSVSDSMMRTAGGFCLGILFILAMKAILDRFEECHPENVQIDDLLSLKSHDRHHKMFLIVMVMTLHSLSEGIGIGVSFGGKSGMKLGQFISLSLAVHNIPEGLAVGLVMAERKVSPLRSFLWAIFTSIPQPIFSVPAFLFIERFIPLLPGGLGFAAGAMAYVAVFELLVEAAEQTSLFMTGLVGVLACIVMTATQELLKHSV